MLELKQLGENLLKKFEEFRYTMEEMGRENPQILSLFRDWKSGGFDCSGEFVSTYPSLEDILQKINFMIDE